jgi:hypothetical protein
MSPTPQAALFVFQEVWTQAELEDYICGFSPADANPQFLQSLLEHPLLVGVDYISLLANIALPLLMAGHQRSLPLFIVILSDC